MTADDKIAEARALVEETKGHDPGPYRMGGPTGAGRSITSGGNYVGAAIGKANTGLFLAAPDLRDTVATLADLADAQAQEIARLKAADVSDDASALTQDILAELTRARQKFPGKNVTFAALVEEVGELATAIFEESAERVRKEAVQVAVMAMRVILDGDHAYEPWRAEKGLDPLCPQARAALGDAP